VKPDRWLEIIILFTFITMVIVFFVPGDSPFSVVRYAFSFVYILFLPGYCLVNILFLGPDRLDPVETTVLSVALSFGIAGLTGLFLGLSPIRIDFASIVISLNAIVLGLAVVAFVRKTKTPKATKANTVEQGTR